MRAKLRLDCTHGCGTIGVSAERATITRSVAADRFSATYRCPRCNNACRAAISDIGAAECVAAGISVTVEGTDPVLDEALAALDGVETIDDIDW